MPEISLAIGKKSLAQKALSTSNFLFNDTKNQGISERDSHVVTD
jgi:hypothetical protein